MSSYSKRLTPPIHITTSSDDPSAIEVPPSIQVQYVDSDVETHYFQPTGAEQNYLFAHRSAPSDSASDCYSPASSPSSVSSSPYLEGHSPQQYFTGFNTEPDRLSLDYNTAPGLFSSNHSPSLSMSELSLSTPTDDPDNPISHLPGNPPFSPVYNAHPNRHFLSMPELSPGYLETSYNQLCFDQHGLRRIASTSFDSISNDEITGHLDFSYSVENIEYPIKPISSPHRSPSPNPVIMNNIQDLIEGDLLDGQTLDIRELHDEILQAMPAHQRHLLKSPKNRVASAAGRLASDNRRKHPARFKCPFDNCSSSFTRKLGLKNHVKSHLGVADQQCRFCKRLLPNSLARHERRCKLNPDREPPRSNNNPHPAPT